MTVSLVDEGARYQIRVQGRLTPEWSTRLGDLKLAVHGGGGHAAVTDLSGWVADQAALMGVLQQLYALGVTILSVERLTRGRAGARGGATRPK
jgi:hypothetical protein